MRAGGIQQVAARLRLGRANRNRDWLQFPCPFAPWTHQSGRDRNPSFGIRINDRGSSHYYCFACKQAGNLSELPMNLHSRDTRRYKLDAAMADMFTILNMEAEGGFGEFDGGEVEPEPDPLDERAYGSLYEPVGDYPVAVDYLHRRGVSDYAMARLDIQFDAVEQRVVWPVRDAKGALYGYTGRTILPENQWPRRASYQKSKDYLGLPKKYLLLGAHLVDADKPNVVVEGPVDVSVAVSLLEGEPYNVLGLLGSVFTQPKLDLLISWGQPVYALLDDDEAGDVGLFGDGRREGGVHKLHREVPVHVPAYENGATDPGELAGKPEVLLRMLSACSPWEPDHD